MNWWIKVTPRRIKALWVNLMFRETKQSKFISFCCQKTSRQRDCVHHKPRSSSQLPPAAAPVSVLHAVPPGSPCVKALPRRGSGPIRRPERLRSSGSDLPIKPHTQTSARTHLQVVIRTFFFTWELLRVNSAQFAAQKGA